MKHKTNVAAKKPLPKVLLILLIVSLCVVCIMLALKKNDTVFVPLSENPQATSVPQKAGVKSNGQIAVPGYESLTLIADTVEQKVSLTNPAQNNCLFVISLYLPDGTLLWESEDILPGTASTPLALTTPLASGIYKDCKLHYSCFTTDENRVPLNSAEIKLNLIIQ